MPAQAWDEDLKRLIKREHGPGWYIEPQAGKVKLVRHQAGQRRQAVSLPLPWQSGSASQVVTQVAAIKRVMADHGLALLETHRLMSGIPEVKSGHIDWLEVAARYERDRIGSGQVKQANFDSNERYRLNRSLELIRASKGGASDGSTLLKLYSSKYLVDIPFGSSGRKRNLLDVCRFLNFAVKKCGADLRWLPPKGEEVQKLIGFADVRVEPTVPIKPVQLLGLLNALEDSPELRMAVALVGLYGLRPSELMTLEAHDGRLFVGPVKRNRFTAKQVRKPRLVLPLELKELPLEGVEVLRMYSFGGCKLPTSIRNAKDFKPCGDYFRQYLERNRFWQSLVSESPGIVPYSLRHGYAWRGAKYYGRSIPVRDMAALMGHDVRTHQRHYGAWTDEAGLIKAVEDARCASL